MTQNRSKVLIIGGYGSFGGRLAKLLSNDARLEIVVAGRSARKAETFVSALDCRADLAARQLDRDGDLTARLAEIAADIVVDASGPWQSYGPEPYRVAKASIQAGSHYLDLADGTDFVSGITELEDLACEQNVYALSGASTCPVLTAAVARQLSESLDVIESITGGIAPSPFAGMGKNVVSAIAGYAGKPVELLSDGRTTEEHTFVSTSRFTIGPPGVKPLVPMTFSLIDVPDLVLLRSLDKPVNGVWFGVSTRPASYHALLRLLARGVKSGLIPSLKPLAVIMHFVMNHLSWGEHRGGMFMEVTGSTGDESVIKSWHLIAEGDIGPNIPALAAVAIIRATLEGNAPPPGARPAKDALTLADYEPMFTELDIATGIRECPEPAEHGLFQKSLGDAWHDLPSETRCLHGEGGIDRFSGRATVVEGKSPLAKLLVRLMGLPTSRRDIALSVRMERSNGQERWFRDFAGQEFSTRLQRGTGRMAGLLCERFACCEIGMALVIDGDKLRMVPRRWSFLGLPMPGFLMPRGAIFEYAWDGRFHFHVEIRMPVVGSVVTYKGWLVPAD